ncbi:aldo/keto reductase [Streptomyces sparsogenes]|uniref:aldo/keto reductase n=1 Tax=Streptomyces sparsogenes TaxID=67365 RepID=UPI003F4CE677
MRPADALRPIAERRGVSVAEVAIAWALAWPGITGAIVGARQSGQVDGWIGAGAVELTPADLDEIASAITATGAAPRPTSTTRGRCWTWCSPSRWPYGGWWPRGPRARGPRARGPRARGPVAQEPASEGFASEGLASDGLASSK